MNEYNKTIHSSTGFAPQHLLFGKNIQIIPKELEIEIDIKKDREKAYQNSIKSHAYNKQNFDKHRKNINLKVGDLVYIDRGNKLNRGKLEQIRIGPFPVSEIVSPNIFKIKQNSKMKDNRNYHISKLVPVSND